MASGLLYENYEEVVKKVELAKKTLRQSSSSLDDQAINDLVEQRIQAKASKDWAKADEIRDKLSAEGILLKDNPDGTVNWYYK